ncbi:hypothetical protein AXW67_25025 [Bradyrhizobium neotropicale]|uniref:Uncharacterized protein n=1 Tax=Bradyrhizobium neotropicale TaxID=1497615 RepID=A0A176YVW4_9BRAD|nr:hypothetical protein AXW67_25025 [Bradyrhizobium neotropicale]
MCVRRRLLVAADVAVISLGAARRRFADGIGDLRIGNEFLLLDSIADVSAEECRGRKLVVLTLLSSPRKR